jgi:hypothetical protein
LRLIYHQKLSSPHVLSTLYHRDYQSLIMTAMQK